MEMSVPMSNVQHVWGHRVVVAMVQALRRAGEMPREWCTILFPGCTRQKERSPVFQCFVIGVLQHITVMQITHLILSLCRIANSCKCMLTLWHPYRTPIPKHMQPPRDPPTFNHKSHLWCESPMVCYFRGGREITFPPEAEEPLGRCRFSVL